MSHTNDNPIHVLVVGVGDAGAQAVNNMRVGVDGAKFAIINEDHEGAYLSAEEDKVRVEDDTSLHEQVDDFDIVFVVANMGEDFGVAYAARIGFIAKEKGALTIGVVTGLDGEAHGITGEHRMVRSVDTLIVIPDQSLDSSATENPFGQALPHVVRTILDLSLIHI